MAQRRLQTRSTKRVEKRNIFILNFLKAQIRAATGLWTRSRQGITHFSVAALTTLVHGGAFVAPSSICLNRLCPAPLPRLGPCLRCPQSWKEGAGRPRTHPEQKMGARNRLAKGGVNSLKYPRPEHQWLSIFSSSRTECFHSSVKIQTRDPPDHCRFFNRLVCFECRHGISSLLVSLSACRLAV